MSLDAFTIPQYSSKFPLQNTVIGSTRPDAALLAVSSLSFAFVSRKVYTRWCVSTGMDWKVAMLALLLQKSEDLPKNEKATGACACLQEKA